MKTTYPVTLKGKSYWLVSHQIMGGSHFAVFLVDDNSDVMIPEFTQFWNVISMTVRRQLVRFTEGAFRSF